MEYSSNQQTSKCHLKVVGFTSVSSRSRDFNIKTGGKDFRLTGRPGRRFLPKRWVPPVAGSLLTWEDVVRLA